MVKDIKTKVEEVEPLSTFEALMATDVCELVAESQDGSISDVSEFLQKQLSKDEYSAYLDWLVVNGYLFFKDFTYEIVCQPISFWGERTTTHNCEMFHNDLNLLPLIASGLVVETKTGRTFRITVGFNSKDYDERVINLIQESPETKRSFNSILRKNKPQQGKYVSLGYSLAVVAKHFFGHGELDLMDVCIGSPANDVGDYFVVNQVFVKDAPECWYAVVNQGDFDYQGTDIIAEHSKITLKELKGTVSMDDDDYIEETDLENLHNYLETKTDSIDCDFFNAVHMVASGFTATLSKQGLDIDPNKVMKTVVVDENNDTVDIQDMSEGGSPLKAFDVGKSSKPDRVYRTKIQSEEESELDDFLISTIKKTKKFLN